MDILQDFQISLSLIRNIDKCNVRIYDDCSTEFDEVFLKKLFPYAAEIKIRSKNVGPSMNISLIFRDFLKTNDDVLFMADSDLVFHTHCLTFIENNFQFTDGFFSLFNSPKHKSLNETIIMGYEYCEKKTVGSAGSVFSKELVRDMVANLPHAIEFGHDLAWSDYLYNTKKARMLVSKKSYVQHVGFYGSHCNGLNEIDYGLNFESDNVITSSIIIKYLEKFIFTLIGTEKDIMYGKIIESIYDSITYKVGHMLLLPLKKIRNYLDSLR
jgi:hypothetical protein